MKKTKIEWADSTWNPITGCRHGCPYCYAASIAKRFCGNVRENKSHFSEYGKKGSGLYVLEKPYHDETGAHRAFPFGFAPTFHKYRLGEPARLNGRTIFVGSMCDLFGDWVPKEWLNDVINSCLEGPQHNYLFLTKNPRMYEELGKLRHEPNFWFGTSVTCNADVEKAHALYCALCSPDKSFISFEPLREKISFDQEDSCTDTWNNFDWFIIGAETGNHSGKVVPDPEWLIYALYHTNNNYFRILIIALYLKLLADMIFMHFTCDFLPLASYRDTSRKLLCIIASDIRKEAA